MTVKERSNWRTPLSRSSFNTTVTSSASIGIRGLGLSDDKASDSTDLVRQIFAGKALHKTVRQERRDGKVLDLAVHGVPLMVNGQVAGAYLIYEDVSEQSRASEAQRQHAESLNQLVKELELRTNQTTSLNEMGSLLACSANVQEACEVVG